MRLNEMLFLFSVISLILALATQVIHFLGITLIALICLLILNKETDKPMSETDKSVSTVKKSSDFLDTDKKEG